jgi:hypothetical protein
MNERMRKRGEEREERRGKSREGEETKRIYSSVGVKKNKIDLCY